ncbi:DHHW family protein [Hespellia stercorisuis]|uniref:DHHW protein n=1 Tax=Hespellia stercorisuis DSM 15480 TaxID=1121950 RepID=A0A1M6N9J5_9FIRM|nr:DHHW family protein [Hespellia stercorisuis]SHJ92351.1 DHHW protein [Hespellia stercorisuis DSM 15480]
MSGRKHHRKINEKKLYRGLAVTFLCLVFAAAILCVLVKDRKFSGKENRNLQMMPAITKDSILSGDTQKDLEAYASDQFLFRDWWIGFQSGVQTVLGRNESHDVFRGKGGYLIQAFADPDEQLLTEQTGAMKNFAADHPDVKTYAIIVPTASYTLADRLPANAPAGDQKSYLDAVAQNLEGSGINFIDVADDLSAHKDEYLYYKTDHHWTSLGAYYAYQAAIDDMELGGSPEDYKSTPVSVNFQGTLVPRSGYGGHTYDQINVYFNEKMDENTVAEYVAEQKKVASLYDSAALKTQNQYEVFTGGNHPLIKVNAGVESDRRLLIFKDSYANCFIPFMTETFRKIVVVDPRYYYEDIEELMKSEKITDVLYLYNADTFSADTSLVPVLENQ